MLADWLGRHAYSAADAANALGCPVVTFRGWVAGRSEPDYFTKCAIVRQMRDGHDPLSDVRMSPVEFTDALKCWRAKHGFTQREAAAAIGTSAETVRGWESQDGVPRQPALGEILRRLRMPVDVELVKQATKRPRPIEPEKFAELMRAWRRRCKLSRSAGRPCTALRDRAEDDRPDDLGVGKRQGAAAAALRRAGTHPRPARGEPAEAEAADRAQAVRDAARRTGGASIASLKRRRAWPLGCRMTKR